QHGRLHAAAGDRASKAPARGDQHLTTDGARRRAPGADHRRPRQPLPLGQPRARDAEHRLAITPSNRAASDTTAVHIRTTRVATAHITADTFSRHHLSLARAAGRIFWCSTALRGPLRRRARSQYHRTLAPQLE